MPLMPKRVKYRKSQRGSRKGTASRNLRIDFGEFGLQTLERAWITNTQIEAARVALTRNMKRKGKLWIRIFPDKSVSSRPPETRMGKGKGQPEFWVATVRPGNILFELDGVPESVASESLRLAADKLPVRTKFLSRHHVRALSVMKIKEIMEMSMDELLTKRRDLRQESVSPAVAAAKRPAGTAEPVAFPAARHGADRDSAVSARETNENEVIYGQEDQQH